MNADPVPLLEVDQISKQFPGVRALHQVSLTLKRGEILAVIGENGAGKSTLMKILAGVQEPNQGRILVDGQPVQIATVQQALDLGISLIHQELNLADNLDVGANIFLGREPLRNGFIDRQTIRDEAQNYLDMIGLTVSPETRVSSLAIGHQQMIEIAKALSVNARVLILDEPTSSLSARESERLFQTLRDLRSQGVSMIYISHRLGEVQALADRVTVLRDGENAGHLDAGEINHNTMVRLMVGRDLSQFYARRERTPQEVLLEVDDLVTPTWPQHQLSFQVRAGEIVGLAGLVGAGRTEMLRTLFGIDQALSGTVSVAGRQVNLQTPQAAIHEEIALVPEDRKQHGLLVEDTVRRNIGLPGLRRNRYFSGFLNSIAETNAAETMTDRLAIRTPGLEQISQFLSGGNQQKVVLAKWLALRPRILLLDEPTRGIDVGAKREIYRLMEELAHEGVAILFVSSEMEEILGMSDRVLVMHEGRLAGELNHDQVSEESVMQLATGGTISV